jgi:catechol 2,3-dioxygenase-like lactoylglutathione lyase family enzyme
MAVQRLNHFTVMTEDLDRSIEFYKSVLGMTSGWRPPFPFPGAWLYCDGSPVLHLVAGRGAREGQGVIDHIAFTAVDLRETISILKSRGVGYTVRRQPGTGEWQVFCHDPSGARVELDFSATEPALDAD